MLSPQIREELTDLSNVLSQVVGSPTVDPNALNRLLEMSRDMKMSYPTTNSGAQADLSDLDALNSRASSLINQVEEIADGIFPNDGQPIVQGDFIRTKYGNAPLPRGNILDTQFGAQLVELSDALARVMNSPNNDVQALNKVLELSRDMQLNYL